MTETEKAYLKGWNDRENKLKNDSLLEYHRIGIIKNMFNHGGTSINFYTYFRYYEVYQAYKAKGLSNNKSYEFAADECGTSEPTIRKAVKIVTG